MMKIDILTLFPSMFEGPLNTSLLGKAKEKGILGVNIVDIRQFAEDKHKTADDSSYGGGPGMVMKADTVLKAIESIGSSQAYILLMGPAGSMLTNHKARELAKHKHLVIICGHYEGIDERVKTKVNEEISIGDYVLTGGEIAAMVVIDAVARFIPGVVGDEESVKNDSFYNGMLDHPHYTRPEGVNGIGIPEVLKNGNHAQIGKWRRKKALEITLLQRPDMLAKAHLSSQDQAVLQEIILGQ